MKHNHLIGRLSVRILINLFILLLALNFLATAAQARPSPAVHKLDGTYLKKLVKDTGLVLSSPGRWEKTDWLRFGLCLASTSAFLPLDNSIHRQVYEHDSRALTSASKVFSAVGAPVSLVGLISAGYLFGHFQNSDSTRETFLLAGESLLITELLVQAGKISIGRARPYTLEGAFSFHPVTLQGKWQSFPSGHSAAAWAVAATLAGRVKSPGLRAVIYACLLYTS
ncbi:MAG: phosphatase PAP2 family protein, partial [Candidatus Saccharicenans sp.]|nr:phosphatase PAP2 family protein [Candidatus Saccharicenans sp.]